MDYAHLIDLLSRAAAATWKSDPELSKELSLEATDLETEMRNTPDFGVEENDL